MLSLLRQFWRTLLAISGLVGIVYLYPDIRDLPDTYPILKRVADVERETILIAFSALLVLYVAWIDARPLLLTFFTRRSILAGEIECVSYAFKYSGQRFFRNRYYLPIVNTVPSGRTIKWFRAFIQTMFDYFPAEFFREEDQSSIDLRSGQKALIYVGEYISREPLGMFRKGQQPNDSVMNSFLKNEPVGNIVFYTYETALVLSIPADKKGDNKWSVEIQALGENMKSQSFNIEIGAVNGKPNVKVIDYLGQSFEPHKLVGTAIKRQRKTRPG